MAGALTGDPLLGPLADNGGPTPTHALLPGSPAVDAGDEVICEEATINNRDQRGVRRPQGAHCDLGAFERSVSDAWSGVLQPINSDGTSVFRAGATVPVRFRLTDDFAQVTDLVARFSYAKISNGVAGPVNEATSTSAATTGNTFRYDWNEGVYIFNWSTRGLGAGTYQVQIDLGDGLIHTVLVGLR